MNSGTCLCGDIEWQVDGDFGAFTNCHCSVCRKIHGTAYVGFVATPVENFSWVRGEEHVAHYASSDKGERGFCPQCGSSVPSVSGEYAFMAAGSLDGDIGRALDSHIFVGSKAEWFDITDDIPQFDEYPPGWEMASSERPTRLPKTDGAVAGSCDCGKIRYEFDGPGFRMGSCHCSRCRKARSAAFSTQLFVMTDRFRWLAGEDNTKDYHLPNTRLFITTFCTDCGSPVPRAFEEFDVFMIPAGSLDGDPGVRLQAHIYVGSKADWHDITDDLPQFDEMPPD